MKDREEWLKNRTKIGGSDASCIVGMNPYKNNVDLWLEKTGQATPEDISEVDYVKYGINAEEHLRELFKLDFPKYKVDYIENNMFFNPDFPFAHASLDGWLTDENGRMGILEIKTTEILQSMQKEKWNNKIPDNYYIQILHYLMVTEFDFAVLKAQLKTKIEKTYLITGDDRYLCYDALKKIEDALQITIKDMNMVTISGEQTTAKDIVDSANMYPFGDVYRMVVVKNFAPNKNQSEQDIIKAYAKQPLDSTVLVFFNPDSAEFFKGIKEIETIDCSKIDVKTISI